MIKKLLLFVLIAAACQADVVGVESSNHTLGLLIASGLVAAIVFLATYKRKSAFDKKVESIGTSNMPASDKLDLIIAEYYSMGFLVQSRSNNIVQFAKKKSFNGKWAIFNFFMIFVYGIGFLLLIAQLLIFLAAKDETATVIV